MRSRVGGSALLAEIAVVRRRAARAREQAGQLARRRPDGRRILLDSGLDQGALESQRPVSGSGRRRRLVADPVRPDPPAIEAQFAKLAPGFAALSGLKQKYFTVNQQRVGGIYLWASRAAADAVLDAAWRADVAKAYGAAPAVTYFDAPLVIQGKAAMP